MPIFTARSASTLAWALLCSTATGFCPRGRLVAPRRRSGPRPPPAATADIAAGPDPESACQVLLLDHVNLNHERGRHDALTAFYFEFLGCAIDPRKYENYRAGAKTVWANIGMQQFHLPEGTPDAQVFDGVITLVYDDFKGLRDRYNEYLDGHERFTPLKDTEFVVGLVDDMMLVTDPWGSQFVLLSSDDPVEDRGAHLGAQPTLEGHAPSAGLALEELTVHVAHGANLAGIGRFYADVLGAPVVDALASECAISIAMGERQLLTFQWHPDGPTADVSHHDYSYDDLQEGEGEEGRPRYPANGGPHISLYVTNLRHAYERAERLGALYVNPRFSRRAYTRDEALEQCMFRIMEIYDPLDEEREVIVSLEHEVRSATTMDGRKYKSCPLLEIPV